MCILVCSEQTFRRDFSTPVNIHNLKSYFEANDSFQSLSDFLPFVLLWRVCTWAAAVPVSVGGRGTEFARYCPSTYLGTLVPGPLVLGPPVMNHYKAMLWTSICHRPTGKGTGGRTKAFTSWVSFGAMFGRRTLSVNLLNCWPNILEPILVKHISDVMFKEALCSNAVFNSNKYYISECWWPRLTDI